jgi:hypothetical protein
LDVKERLRHPSILNQTSADIKINELQQQQNLLAETEADLDKMGAAYRSSPEKGEETVGKETSLEEAVFQQAVPTGTGLAGPDAWGESTASGDLHAATRAGMPQVDATGQSVTQAFTPHLYQRLSHPLCHLIKELNVADGTNADILCAFLLKVIKIREIGKLYDIATYELMFPHCRGELLCAVEQAIRTRQNFEFSCPTAEAVYTFERDGTTLGWKGMRESRRKVNLSPRICSKSRTRPRYSG